MARRRNKKDKSLIQAAIEGDWKFSATVGSLILFASLIIPSLISNKFLVKLLSQLQPIGILFACIFLLIALFKFIKFNSAHKELPQELLRNEPVERPKDIYFNDEMPIRNTVSNSKESPKEWTLKLIQDLEWKRFEELCIAIYNERGMRAETTELGADGGIDIKLYQADSKEPSAIAQCKAWKGKVGVKPIREFLGVMTHEKISKGFYLTPSSFTDEAKEIAKANGLTLFSGDLILMMLKRLSKESQDKLYASITKGDYTTPSCAKCGIKMIRRKGKQGEFWGCANYPRCRQTLRLRSVDHENRKATNNLLY
jgi:restriction system protein